MRILIISFVFPPHNIIGAVRVGKTAKYLSRLSHDVRVIAAAELDIDPTLELEIAPENVVYTPWTDVDRPLRAILGTRDWIRQRIVRHSAKPHGRPPAATRPQAFNSEGPQSERRTVGWRLRLLYSDLVHIPDSATGWRRHAVRAGLALTRDWHPDVILASGAPWTSFVVARDLAARLDVPWVADLRDLWSANHTTFVSEWRKRTLDSWYEGRVLRTATALVTVSEPLAAKLRDRYPEKRVEVILNGYDEDDYKPVDPPRGATRPFVPADVAARRRSSEVVLRLVYTGEINRNMYPLLEALRMLEDDARGVRVEIIGPQNPAVHDHYCAVASDFGIADRFAWLPAVSHADAVRFQQGADLLLLLMHDTPDDAGVYTGKLFEYIGARRPILLCGTTSGVAARLVRDRKLGFSEASPERIAQRLRDWLQEKSTSGGVAAPDAAAVDDLSRESQTRAYIEVLRRASEARSR